MYKVKFTPYRKESGQIYHRQTKGHSLVSLDGRYKFYIDEPCPEPDFWVVQGKGLRHTETCLVAPENTIMLTTEPRSVLVYPQKYLNQFGMVCTCQENTRHPGVVYGPPVLPWFIGCKDNVGGSSDYTLDYDLLKSMPVADKSRLISVITSNKAFTRGHIERMRFVEILKEHFGNKIDVFGRGFNDFEDKWDVLSQYRYHVVIENSCQPYYWTEKMSDCLIAETLPFYHGCTNMADYVPDDSFIGIDINKPQEALRIIDEAIERDEYERRKAVLHEAKQLMLDRYNMFEVVAGLCDRLDAGQKKEPVTLDPCRSGADIHNLFRYSIGRKLYETRWKLFHR